MYHLRYEGSFLSHSDVRWKVQIFQVAEEAFPEVGELRFDAEEPLVVEWEDVKKQGTVQGSTLTLQLDSPSDREYVHLYTISPRGVQVRVFRQKVLWWVGVMDSELYEEPYERENHYTVTLTFSDFAIADRLLLDQTGTVTLQELLSSLFKRGALYTTEGDAMQEVEEEFLDRLDTSLISTTLPEEEEATLTPQRVAVSVSSFKEDEEEPETLRGALEKVMQPLGLRLVQKAGKLWLYDLHGLYLYGQRRPVTWNGAEQTLSVDSVIPAVSIKFKPEDEDAISPDVATPLLYKGGCYGRAGFVKSYVFNSNQRAENDWHAEFGIFNGHSAANTATENLGLSHVLLLDSSMGSGPAYIHPRAAYARIVQCFSGDRKDFILWRTQPDLAPVVNAYNTGYVYGVRTEIVQNGKDYLRLDRDAAAVPAANFFANNADRSLLGTDNVLLRTAPVYLPKIDETTTDSRYPKFEYVNGDGTWKFSMFTGKVFTYGLRLSIPMLVSPRYNLFGGDEDWNDKLNAQLLTANLRAIFLPVRVRLRNYKNDVIYHWDNYMMEGADKEVAIDTNKPLDMEKQWMTGDYEDGEWALLTYAEYENDANRPTGVKFSSSAQTNKGQVYAAAEYLNKYKRYDGEILPYPPEAGFLDIEVGAGLRFLTVFDYPDGILNVTGAYFFERGLIYANHLHDKTYKNVNGDIVNLAKRPAYYNWLLRTIGVEMPKLTPVIRRSYPFAPFEDESDGTFEELAANEDKGEARYEGYIDSDAAELISIDNKIGTRSVETPNPTGLLLSATTLRQLRKIRRADIADAPEWLLAATLFSHHDSPHLILSGEAVADPEGPAAYTDDPRQTARQAISLTSAAILPDGTVDEQLLPLAVNWWDNTRPQEEQGYKVMLPPKTENPLGLPNFRDFLLASETFDAISDTSEINLIEINPDIYVREDYPIPSDATEEEKALLNDKKKFKTGKQPNRII